VPLYMTPLQVLAQSFWDRVEISQPLTYPLKISLSIFAPVAQLDRAEISENRDLDCLIITHVVSSSSHEPIQKYDSPNRGKPGKQDR
jgi:hypothetical protein